MAKQTKKSFCRLCSAYCAIDVEVEDNKVIAILGDADDPVTGGYTCIKGRQYPYQVHSDKRLSAAKKRLPDGSYENIPTRQALDEIAEKLKTIIDQHGPRAVASFCGTMAYANAPTVPVAKAWHEGIGSVNFFSTMTIDQPAKVVAVGRHGTWAGGFHTFITSDVALSIGNNAIVSGLSMPGGPPGTNASRTIRDAIARGLKLIVVDPRKTELARLATLHLQVRPGEDATLLAGLIHIIIEEGLYDKEFCTEYVGGLEEMRAAIADYTPEYVGGRCGVPKEQVIEAARLFAQGPRGCASSGTGPDMATHACLTEHLLNSLNSLCGRYNREGERVPNPGPLSATLPRLGEPIPGALLPEFFHIGQGTKSRVADLYRVCGEMPAGTLAEEILVPGEGQVHALLTVGANPLLALPDQQKMARALDSLELHVCVDIEMSASARTADYVLPARHQLEREDATDFMDMFYEVPYANYTMPVIEAEGDVIEDWEFYLELARRLDTSVAMDGGEIDLNKTVSKLDVLKCYKPDTRIPWDEVRAKGRGFIYEMDVRVTPPMLGIDAKLQLVPEGIVEELREVRSQAAFVASNADGCFSHQMICSRLRHTANSIGQSYPGLREESTTNYAHISPADLDALGISDEELVEIKSAHGTIVAVAKANDKIRNGVVSISHCWGSENGDVRDVGVNTNQLIAWNEYADPITGQPRMSAVPVRLAKV